MRYRICVFILLVSILFFSCKKDSGHDASGTIYTENEVYSHSHEEISESFSKILFGDLSDFSGVWVNNSGRRSNLRSDGTISQGMKSDNFRRSDDNYYASGAYYQWDIHSTQDEYGIQNGYSMILVPAGLEIKDGNRIFLSDTSKTRLLIMQNEFNPSSQIYYWEDVMPEQFNAQELRISNFITSDNYYDLSLPGSLSPGQGIWYSVRTAEAGFLNVSASSDIDTYLEAYDQDMKLIAQNDDWENWNPVIEFLAKANTLYYFRINSYSGNDSGPFRITALHKPLLLITEMTNGSFIRAYIEAGEEHWYSVTVTEGDFLSIWTEGNIDTVIDAYTENYVHFTRNDDSWYGDYVDRNANLWINIYDVKAGTVYLFRLTSFDSGAYRILVSMDYAQG